VLQQNSLPNFLEAAPGGGSFQKIGCAIVFAQALTNAKDQCQRSMPKINPSERKMTGDRPHPDCSADGSIGTA
jgi:hypothetical protein